MSCIVSDVELAGINVMKELVVFLMGLFRKAHLALKKTETKVFFFVYKKLHGVVKTVHVWITVSIPTFFLRT